MDKHYNKTIKIDGAPGITLEGKKGSKGKNGGMLFFTDCIDHTAAFGKFDIWPFNQESNAPYFINKYNFCKYTAPSINDYILTHIQNTSYVYIINAVIDKNSIREGNLEPFIEAGLITQDYAEKILDYYESSQQNYNDCCFVSEVSSLDFFTSIAGKNFDINISKAMTEDIPYEAYTGIILENQKMGLKEEIAEFATFNITPAESSSIKNMKIEAEFYTDTASPEMGSIIPTLWSNPNDSTVTSNNYPFGYLENYNYKINYDSENLDNFTVILKEWNSETGLNVKIPISLFDGYTVYIYAYIAEDSNEKSLNKYYIASISGNDITDL